MKIIHCADIHLGCALADLGREKSEERRRELRATFERIISFAEQNGVRAIILAGDVFDTARPYLRDKKFFYDAVRAHPSIDFLYLRGNHDIESGYECALENLKTFSSKWQGYRYDDADIYGAELPYDGDMYAELMPERNSFNIVILHGQLNADFNIVKLRNKNIDYLALGHIHTYSSGDIDVRGKYAYCGCPEGRGFDETGEKGFILLDTAARSMQFIPFARRTIREYDADIGGCSGAYEAYERIRRMYPPEREAIVRFNLRGNLDFRDARLAKEIKSYLSDAYYFVDVKDKTSVRANVAADAAETTLKGQFCRSVLSDPSLSDEDKARVIDVGLNALSGKEGEI